MMQSRPSAIRFPTTLALREQNIGIRLYLFDVVQMVSDGIDINNDERRRVRLSLLRCF